MNATAGTSLRHTSSYLLLTLTVLFWSGNAVLARAMHQDIPPMAMAFWRWVVALAILAPFALSRIASQRALIMTHWKLLAALSLLGAGAFNTLLYVGLQSTTATNAVLLNSAIPVLIIALSRVFLGYRLRPLQALGVALSLSGVVAIIARGDPATLLTFTINPGDLWILAAVLCWAGYTVLLRWRPPGLDPLAFLGVMVALAVAAIAPLYAAELAAGQRMTVSAATVSSLAYFGAFPAVLAYVFWNRAVGEVGPSVAGLFIHLMPVFGTLLSVLFLGESVHPFHGAGIGLILAGIYLTTRPAVQ